jgi:hypothetical protein
VRSHDLIQLLNEPESRLMAIGKYIVLWEGPDCALSGCQKKMGPKGSGRRSLRAGFNRLKWASASRIGGEIQALYMTKPPAPRLGVPEGRARMGSRGAGSITADPLGGAPDEIEWQ